MELKIQYLWTGSFGKTKLNRGRTREVERGSNTGFVHHASHHFILLHPAIPPNETFPSLSRLLVLVNMQLM